MSYKAIIFDLFGTLIENYTVQGYDRTLAEMAAVLAAPRDGFAQLWRESYYARNVGTLATVEANVVHVCQQIGLRPEQSQISAATAIRRDLTARALVATEETIDTLAELKSLGYRIGLVSDCSSEVPLLWESTPFASLIESPIFSCAVGIKKPDQRIYELACKHLDVEPRECVYVGDGGSGELSGAAAVGMYPILIRASDDDESDAFRVDAEDWEGTRITRIKDIFTILR